MKKELSRLSKIFITILMALSCVQNITVFAAGDTGKVGYYLTLATAKWKDDKLPDGTTAVVEDSGLTKYYYDKSYTYGENFTVTTEVPEVDGYQFIGWLDKKRGDQAATTRKAGDTVTYSYKDGDPYCLDALWASISVTGYTDTYDGQPHTITLPSSDEDPKSYIAFNGGALKDEYIEQAKALITIPTDSKLYYSTNPTDETTWTDTKPTFTDAGTYTVYVKENVLVGENSVTLYGQGTVTITKLSIDITTGGGSKTYDGTALTNSSLTYKDGVEFITGDVTSVAATGTITNVGSTANTIEITYSSDTKANNYNVTKHEGTLEITAAIGLDISSNLKDNAATKVYDGTPLTTTATSTTEGATIKYSIDGGQTWVDQAPSITDEGSLTVTAKATKTNYTDATVTYTLTVTKRPIEIVGESGSKTYTGSEQELTGYSVNTAEGKYDVVTGQVLSTTYSAKGTNVNTDGYAGTFGTVTIKSGETDVTNNYAITITPGKLTITPQTINPGTDPEEKDPAYDGVEVGKIEDVIYNGKTQEEVPTVTDKTQNDLEKDKDYTITYSRDTTNVGKVTVTIEGKGNYTGTIERTYNIKPATLKVVTPSKSKTYDGTELTAEGTLTGLVNNETVEFKTTGKQTSVGSSKNTYSLKWGTAKEGNYTIEESIGTLTVTEKSSKKSSGGWDDGGPFTTDTCGNVFDRWGNKIYEAKGCNVGGYNLVRTSVED